MCMHFSACIQLFLHGIRAHRFVRIPQLLFVRQTLLANLRLSRITLACTCFAHTTRHDKKRDCFHIIHVSVNCFCLVFRIRTNSLDARPICFQDENACFMLSNIFRNGMQHKPVVCRNETITIPLMPNCCRISCENMHWWKASQPAQQNNVLCAGL